MKKTTLFLSLFLLIPAHNCFPLFRQVRGLESSHIERVIISPFNPEVICAAAKNSLYRSQDKGQSFKKVAVFKDETIRHIFFDSHLANNIYIVTSRHFYRLKKGLEKLFTAPDEETLYTAAKQEGVFYVATSQGLSFSAEDALIWRKVKALTGFAVYFLEPAEEGLYVACEGGAYLLSRQGETEQLFAMRREEAEGEEGLAARVIKADAFSPEAIWLGTNHGVFVSEDKGTNWRKLYISGIDNLCVNCLAQTKLQADSVYLGSDKGFFIVNTRKDTARQLFEGLFSSRILWIEFTPEGRIYLATPRGLFKNDYFTPDYSGTGLEEILCGEPSVAEIQQAALRYNEVHPEKIRQWRTGLKYRALFPTVKLDYDKTIYGTYSNGGQFAVGPHDWGVSFSWDVGNLLWNNYQDDVDTRARLNTQLRLDILDEINRVYFERVRLERELDNADLSEEDLFAKQLRLAELTAIIDGYTGGYFSKQIGKKNAKN